MPAGERNARTACWASTPLPRDFNCSMKADATAGSESATTRTVNRTIIRTKANSPVIQPIRAPLRSVSRWPVRRQYRYTEKNRGQHPENRQEKQGTGKRRDAQCEK